MGEISIREFSGIVEGVGGTEGKKVRLEVHLATCTATPTHHASSLHSFAQTTSTQALERKAAHHALIKINSLNFSADITIELRAMGVPWTLHCWMNALAAAHELRLDTVIDQLLQDFLQVCPDDYSQQFVMECLPLLFSIFRYSKVCVSNNFISSHKQLPPSPYH